MSKTGLFAASMLALGFVTGSASAELVHPIADICLARDVQATAAIESHGEVQDLPPRGLYGAALTVQRARAACREGQVDEAVALYDLVLALGPAEVVSTTSRK